MKLLVTVLGLLFVLEAIPYVLFPEAMQRWLARIGQMDAGALRATGLFVLGVGLLLCYITQRTELIP
ncbi:MAG: DUF2065 domain-containing protein [Proteobacteria bacterium]|nr:DUF2065 domain-containing protein [Pseudomonadota bacterium]MBU1546563.1 DUF2065 domain-containing protein [Pseudomonadota bacterium]MBU2618078.1 DUF2065 domain-containing protein [Pseudomonadota bacterium]